jgi:hypothetical protein
MEQVEQGMITIKNDFFSPFSTLLRPCLGYKFAKNVSKYLAIIKEIFDLIDDCDFRACSIFLQNGTKIKIEKKAFGYPEAFFWRCAGLLLRIY